MPAAGTRQLSLSRGRVNRWFPLPGNIYSYPLNTLADLFPPFLLNPHWIWIWLFSPLSTSSARLKLWRSQRYLETIIKYRYVCLVLLQGTVSVAQEIYLPIFLQSASWRIVSATIRPQNYKVLHSYSPFVAKFRKEMHWHKSTNSLFVTILCSACEFVPPLPFISWRLDHFFGLSIVEQ